MREFLCEVYEKCFGLSFYMMLEVISDNLNTYKIGSDFLRNLYFKKQIFLTRKMMQS